MKAEEESLNNVIPGDHLFSRPSIFMARVLICIHVSKHQTDKHQTGRKRRTPEYNELNEEKWPLLESCEHLQPVQMF